MPPIYDEIVLSWEGKEYTAQPSFAMAQRIEGGPGGVSIFGVLHDVERGEPRLTQLAKIASHLLLSGGADTATPDRVYARLVNAGADELVRICRAVDTAFVPREKNSGNSKGPGGDGADEKT